MEGSLSHSDASDADLSSGRSRFRQLAAAGIVNFQYFSLYLAGVSFQVVLFRVGDDWEKYSEQWKTLDITYLSIRLLAYPIFALAFQWFSRKMCSYIICVSYVITSIILLCANSFQLLLAGRAVFAASAVGTRMLSLIYISEIAQDDIRGALLTTNRLFFNLAEIFSAVMQYVNIVNPIAFLPLIISILVAGCMFFWLPETPIYYLRREDTEGAVKSLQWLNGSETDVSREIQNMKKTLKSTRSDARTATNVFQDHFNRRMLGYCGVVSVVCITNVFTAYPTARLELATLLWRISDEPKLPIALLDIFVFVVGNIIAIALCDRVGRKFLLFISALGCSVTLLATGVTYYIAGSNVYDEFGMVNMFTLIFSLMYGFCFNVGLGIVYDVIITDIFPPKLLNTQLAVLGIFAAVLTYVVTYDIYDFMRNTIGVSGAFWIFGSVCGVGALFILKFLPETRNQPPGYVLKDTNNTILLSNLEENEEDEQ